MKKYEKILESLRLKRELNDKYCEQNSCSPSSYMQGSNLILDELIEELKSMKKKEKVQQTENSKSLEHKSDTIEAYVVEGREHKMKMDRVQFFVEATDEERHFLWRENDERGTDDEFGNNKVEWIEDGSGFMFLVGKITSGKTITSVC
jgi:hypothetical protein